MIVVPMAMPMTVALVVLAAMVAMVVMVGQRKVNRRHAAHPAHAIRWRPPAVILLSQLAVAINLCKARAARQSAKHGVLQAHMITCSSTAASTAKQACHWRQ